MGRIRSFFAVAIEEGVAVRITQAQARLKECGASVKWVNPSSFHLTLKFLGEVDASAIPGLIEAVSRTLVGAAAFRLGVAGLGAFPTPAKLRVIWAGIGEGRQALAGLTQRVEAACEEQGFPREARPFSAHLTLGRVGEGGSLGDLPGQIHQGKELDFGESRVDRVILMESRLRPQGPEYLIQSELKLEGERR